ncbi:hypothetical protein [Mycolicibacterium arenosum]|uniref:DUF3558 domain-containing protein n=1 Tax=Mycolicibacterium arenosum TaxID=2952157 RepID=A0ABT1LYW0_9MYCO|nr:hypothetical protein [Mycolicibacterium sp. CAU 1645]MCP9272083.1 hypothetical protein [Mycolicibacterium sp. CAU 1645]
MTRGHSALFFAALCLALAGCSETEPSSATPENDGAAAMSSIESSARADTAGDDADAVDACALLSSADDVAPLIGITVDGVPSGQGATTACLWENPETYVSVSVDIGAPGTAVNNTLPEIEVPTVPGPDGTRSLAGAVEFAADDRYNSVQVASPIEMTADESTAAAMDLIAKIKPQLEG